MDNSLRLNKRIALKKLTILSDILFANRQIDCELNESISITSACTYNDDKGCAKAVEIGVYEIEHAKKSFMHMMNPLVSDTDFARVVLNMYHEQSHCIQKNYLFRLNHLDESSEKQLVQEIACRENYDYYKKDGNYSFNANEIQAEQYGILQAYGYLCEEFPEVDAKQHEAILLEIVNDKMQNSTYFVRRSKPFTSLQEVESAFDKAYDDSFERYRMYYVENKKTCDIVKQYMQTHSEAKAVYLSLDDQSAKDKCVATINLKLHPEWMREYPVLQKMDLSYETLIEKPYRTMMRKKSSEQIREEQLCEILSVNKSIVLNQVQSVKSSEIHLASRAEMAEMKFADVLKLANDKKYNALESEME